MNIDGLLPCPFCGTPPTLVTSWIPREHACRIKCYECGSEHLGRDVWSESDAKAKAIAAWNRRSPPVVALNGLAEALAEEAVRQGWVLSSDLDYEAFAATAQRIVVEQCARVADDHAMAKWGGEADSTHVLRTTAASIAAVIRDLAGAST